MRATIETKIGNEKATIITRVYRHAITPEMLTLAFPDANGLRLILTEEDIDDMKKAFAVCRQWPLSQEAK